jgi:hypothetical protein
MGPSLRWGDGIEIGLHAFTVRLNFKLCPKQGQRNIYDQIPRANFQHGDRGRADIAGGGLAGFEGDGEAAYIVLQRHWREY